MKFKHALYVLLLLCMSISAYYSNFPNCTIYNRPYWGTFPHYCPFVPEEKYCLQTVITKVQAPYSANISGNPTILDYFFYEAGSSLSWTYSTSIPTNFYSVHIQKIDTCPGQDSIFMRGFDTNYVFVPDSIPLHVGDTLVLNNYRLDWYPFEGLNKLNFSYDSSAFAVHGVSFGGAPVSTHFSPVSSFRKNTPTVTRLTSGWLLENPTKRPLRWALIDSNGRILGHTDLAPGERRRIRCDQGVLVKLEL